MSSTSTISGDSILIFQPLLGAYSLEGLGLTVDSCHRGMIPMPVVIVAVSVKKMSEEEKPACPFLLLSIPFIPIPLYLRSLRFCACEGVSHGD